MKSLAQISKKIHFYNAEKLKNINPETLKLYNKYKIDMTLRELSIKTLEGYENDLQHWFIYIYDNQGNQCVTDLVEDDITEFLYFCKTEGNNSRRMKRRMSSISAFYKFLRRKKIITENPMEFMERPKKDTDIITQTFLTPEQVNQMKQKLKENGNLQIETYACLSLSTMARVNAVSNIRWEQIDFENRTINDVLEKEGKMVTLYFNQEVKDLLLRLKQEREEKGIDNEYVFISLYGKSYNKCDTSTLQEWTKKIGNMINVPTLHPHDFRHSGATLLKNKGMKLEDVSTLLNHSGTDVTKRFYIKEDKTKIAQNKDKYEI